MFFFSVKGEPVRFGWTGKLQGTVTKSTTITSDKLEFYKGIRGFTAGLFPRITSVPPV